MLLRSLQKASGSYCFAGIPGSICELFGIKGRSSSLPSGVVFLQEGLLKSPYNIPVLTGAEVVGFKDAGQGLRAMSDLHLSVEERLYTFFYLSDFDSACHKYGPNSGEADEVCHRLFDLLERELLGPLKQNGGDIALMIISDHGQKRVSDCFYLESIPELKEQ